MRVLCEFLVGVLLGTSSAHADYQNVSYRVLGPGGRMVVLFAHAGSGAITLRKCGEDFPPPVEVLSDCVGPESTMPEADFERNMREFFALAPEPGLLQPLSKDQVESYQKGGRVTVEERRRVERDLDARLERIKEFINLGAGDYATRDQALTEKQIAAVKRQIFLGENHADAVIKVNELVLRIVGEIEDGRFLKVADGADHDSASLQALVWIFARFQKAGL